MKGTSDFCVEVAGFEPAAFWSRTKRATKLRYTSTLEPMRGLEPLLRSLNGRLKPLERASFSLSR